MAGTRRRWSQSDHRLQHFLGSPGVWNRRGRESDRNLCYGTNARRIPIRCSRQERRRIGPGITAVRSGVSCSTSTNVPIHGHTDAHHRSNVNCYTDTDCDGHRGTNTSTNRYIGANTDTDSHSGFECYDVLHRLIILRCSCSSRYSIQGAGLFIQRHNGLVVWQ